MLGPGVGVSDSKTRHTLIVMAAGCAGKTRSLLPDMGTCSQCILKQLIILAWVFWCFLYLFLLFLSIVWVCAKVTVILWFTLFLHMNCSVCCCNWVTVSVRLWKSRFTIIIMTLHLLPCHHQHLCKIVILMHLFTMLVTDTSFHYHFCYL